MAKKKEAEAQYAKPASQVDLEERLANGNKSFRELSTSDTFEAPEEDGSGRDFAVEDNELDGYVGTSPEYMTYANETEKPGVAEDGVEAQIFDEFDEATHRPLVFGDKDEDDSDS